MTWILLIGTIVAWFVVEMFDVMTGRATISEDFRNLNKRWAAFGALTCLTLGLLIGHWFFQ